MLAPVLVLPAVCGRQTGAGCGCCALLPQNTGAGAWLGCFLGRAGGVAPCAYALRNAVKKLLFMRLHVP